MNRRDALRALSGATAVALAGCLADGSDGGSGAADTPTDAATPTDDGSETDAGTPTRTPTDVHTRAPGSGGTGTESPTRTDDGEVDTVAGTPPGSDDPSATPVAVVDWAFTVTRNSCGMQADDARVSFDDGVTVTGTTWGNNACYTATLADVGVATDTLTVVVASESDAGTDVMCAQCITEIDYEASFTFDGKEPDEVVVVHTHGSDRSTVATVRR